MNLLAKKNCQPSVSISVQYMCFYFFGGEGGGGEEMGEGGRCALVRSSICKWSKTLAFKRS